VSVTFVVVPQWQGSPSPRAMRQAEGALAIRSDLPASATREVTVPLEAGDEQGTGIQRFSSLQLVRERLRDLLGELDGPAITIGGDCAVSAAAVAHAAQAATDSGGALALVWFDAHPDLNSAESSPSHAFAGMVLRSIIDDGVVAAEHVTLAGTRSWDPDEESYAGEKALRSFSADDLTDPTGLVEAVASSGADRLYLHIDLDVLDPGEVDGLLDPEPFGVSASALVQAIKALTERLPLAGATLAAFAPASAEAAVDDAPTLLRIIGALSKGAGNGR
jgi:arginase